MVCLCYLYAMILFPFSDPLLVFQIFSWRPVNPPLFAQAGIGTPSLSLATTTSVITSHQIHLLGLAYSHYNQASAFQYKISRCSPSLLILTRDGSYLGLVVLMGVCSNPGVYG